MRREKSKRTMSMPVEEARGDDLEDVMEAAWEPRARETLGFHAGAGDGGSHNGNDAVPVPVPGIRVGELGGIFHM